MTEKKPKVSCANCKETKLSFFPPFAFPFYCPNCGAKILYCSKCSGKRYVACMKCGTRFINTHLCDRGSPVKLFPKS